MMMTSATGSSASAREICRALNLILVPSKVLQDWKARIGGEKREDVLSGAQRGHRNEAELSHDYLLFIRSAKGDKIR